MFSVTCISGYLSHPSFLLSSNNNVGYKVKICQKNINNSLRAYHSWVRSPQQTNYCNNKTVLFVSLKVNYSQTSTTVCNTKEDVCYTEKEYSATMVISPCCRVRQFPAGWQWRGGSCSSGSSGGRPPPRQCRSRPSSSGRWDPR